jgi:hypothetical protein
MIPRAGMPKKYTDARDTGIRASILAVLIDLKLIPDFMCGGAEIV